MSKEERLKERNGTLEDTLAMHECREREISWPRVFFELKKELSNKTITIENKKVEAERAVLLFQFIIFNDAKANAFDFADLDVTKYSNKLSYLAMMLAKVRTKMNVDQHAKGLEILCALECCLKKSDKLT